MTTKNTPLTTPGNDKARTGGQTPAPLPDIPTFDNTEGAKVNVMDEGNKPASPVPDIPTFENNEFGKEGTKR